MSHRESRQAPNDIQWDAIVVHFSEIGLKGGNRQPFIKQLKRNLKRAVRVESKIESFHDRLLVRVDTGLLSKLLDSIPRVFGVSYAAAVRMVEARPEVLKRAAVDVYRATGRKGASFAIRAKRADKRFPLTSHEIEVAVGQAVVDATGAPVDLEHPDVLIRFRVHEDSVYLEGPHVPGPNGLPVGVSGRVLTLFSGGIDSPAAAWLSMKRGCVTDFLHIHALPSADAVRESKIPELLRRLVEPQGLRASLYLVPYHVFESALISAAIPPDLELVMFRRFMARVASRLADQQNYAALVTGDNLAQVASQTMANLLAFDDAAGRSVFRPLLTFNKDEIIELTRQIGTYETSIGPYKDCCSIVARHPRTSPKLGDIHAAEQDLPVDEMVERAIGELVEVEVGE